MRLSLDAILRAVRSPRFEALVADELVKSDEKARIGADDPRPKAEVVEFRKRERDGRDL